MTEQEILAFKRSRLEFRHRVLHSIRSYFLQERFLEVQTPIKTPAPAPEDHIEAISTEDESFLCTSPELYMKRLLAAGYERIFQISPVFRKGERGRFHHPEFTMLEWYRLEADYTVLQQDCRKLLMAVCTDADRTPGWHYQGRWLDAAGDFKCFTVGDAFQQYAGWEPGPEVDQNRFDLDLVEKVEPHLGFPCPCILKDYPASQAALARFKDDDSSIAERFELYWGGLELANGFSELTDAGEQRSRFEAVLKKWTQSGRRVYPIPEGFLKSIESLRPCAGVALGVDRLVMLLADASSLDEVVAFPPDLL